MSDLPDFAALLGRFIAAVPAPSRPAFLARLERGAAGRYREWAEQAPDARWREVLLACAAREDEIADRVDAILPADPAHGEAIEAQLPAAIAAYRAEFDPLPYRDQLRVQAGAELQGAAAWQGLAAPHPDEAVRAELATCAELERASSAAVTRLLDGDA